MTRLGGYFKFHSSFFLYLFLPLLFLAFQVVADECFEFYVDYENGDDLNSGASLDEPKKTVDAALEALSTSYATAEDDTIPSTIWLAEGTHELSNAPEIEMRSITKPITIRSISDNPEDTILNLTAKAAMQRHFEVSNDSAVIRGITFRGGSASTYIQAYGWNGHAAQLYNSAGLVTNCVFEAIKNSLSRSACIWLYGSARMVGCVVRYGAIPTGNVDSSVLSAVYLKGNALLSHCVVTNCLISGGNTSHRTTAVKIESNGVVVRNCLIAKNKQTATDSVRNGVGLSMSGGLVENCTIADNENASGGTGTGIYASGGTIINTIIHGNKSPAAQNIECYGVATRATYCCSKELTSGTGNLAVDPRFVDPANDDYRLTPLSNCIDAGFEKDWMTAGDTTSGPYDLDFVARIVGGTPDIGCYESVPPENLPLAAAFSFPVIGNADRAPLELTFTATVIGANQEGVTLAWDFGDGTESVTTAEKVISHTYQTYGRFTPTLTVSNLGGEIATAMVEDGVVIVPSKIFVSKTGSNTFPYDNWLNASTDIQEAANLYPDEIEVGPGEYIAPRTGILVTSATRIYSSNGKNETFITSDWKSNGDTRRLLHLKNSDATVDGFTLKKSGGNSNGYTYFAVIESGNIINCFVDEAKACERSSMISLSNGMISNCVINAKVGSVMNGNGWCPSVTLNANSLLTHSEIYGYNYTYSYLSGPNAAVALNDSTAIIRNCYIHDCSAGKSYGGGIRATSKGGTIENCTIVRSTAARAGGVYIDTAAATTIRNCIVYNNTATEEGYAADIHAANYNKVFNTCASDLTDGENGNISAPPKFASDGCSLKTGSPCRNTGALQPWMEAPGATDIRGNPRIFGDAPDMGAFENCRYLPTIFFTR